MTDLAAGLQAESAALRWQAIEQFNHTGRKAADSTTLAALVKALGDEHPFVRWQAGLALATQREGLPRLVEVIKGNTGSSATDKTELIRSAAVDALAASHKSPDVHTVLLEALQADNAVLRQSAGEALAHQESLEAVSHLINALRDADPWVRRAAAHTLGHLDDRSAVGVLVGSLRDNAVIVRRSVAYALGALRAEVAGPQLKLSLTDGDPQVRRNAAWALGRIGQPEAVPELKRLLDDIALDGAVAETARQAIAAITKPRWLQILSGLSKRAQ